VAIVLVTALTPHAPFAGMLGFKSMPAHFYPIIALIVDGFSFYPTNWRSLFAKTCASDIND
jgi:hypothetical protein